MLATHVGNTCWQHVLPLTESENPGSWIPFVGKTPLHPGPHMIAASLSRREAGARAGACAAQVARGLVGALSLSTRKEIAPCPHLITCLVRVIL